MKRKKKKSKSQTRKKKRKQTRKRKPTRKQKQKKRKVQKPKRTRAKGGGRHKFPANPTAGTRKTITTRNGRKVTFEATGKKGFGAWKIVSNK